MLSTVPLVLSLLLFLQTPVKAFFNEQGDLNGRYYKGSRYRTCETLLERREWRTLNDVEKADYINAVKCLQSHPALDPPITQAQTRFDEFQAYHSHIANAVHTVGQFLPWHRLYLKNYDSALRSECGYTGTAPYWDWTQDAEANSNNSISRSPVWDPLTGFGGDGVPGTYTLPTDFDDDSRINPPSFVGCVPDGPFANYTLRIGPGLLNTDHCLVRGFNESAAQHLTSAAIANATKQQSFELFRIEVEGQPLTSDHRMHDGGHIAIGGEMSNFFSSPGDPMFYLHHANIDRIWWTWQQAVPSRLYEIAGPSSTVEPIYNVTLEYPLLMGSLGPTLQIRDIMDIHAEPSCYTYIRKPLSVDWDAFLRHS
ncbi:hypothetical protein CPB84DRAFT_1745537 [Gymnopilus junonius]|uniref:Tyrosinase copper-binding domain-containing protein n=1 Tax=Gymnopilus junonius TaxID=109634 RepID=A0A9P5NQI8_GYMJU|nr:hypothetical protein CPB84DRAFT_1745537 [Gymnopilus junonius]